ncbi:MAG: thioredoxin-dependent thiol peroxidase [Candidatus Marinimicrobia bacterium]|nr:thioredoxin-dependent thiol peroxidase [Candidatus Neomarinimicrobiota bacterium]MCF7829108.1 thioredoxin-dependent thiol peroxidase [Candidatus Neomarinimicrobiota bacterium]MCF7881493.1 thioredoxin-dependent thiol peroxidase [Candidatus Neomarinimicrobiota bacterium]
MLEVGEKAPDFTLNDAGGNPHTLSDYRGQKVVVYFYPKDDTPGCTKEACSFRDADEVYREHNIKVFGISNDDEKSHQKFKEKYNLHHTLLADVDNEVCPMYGAYGTKKMYGKEYEGIKRMTFLLDEDGVITKIFKRVKTDVHAEEVLDAFGLSE